MQGLITDRLRVARGVLDEGWAVYDLSSEEARNDARDALIRRAIDHSFPAHGMVLSTGDVTLLADEAEDARRSWMALLRLRVDGNGTDPEPAEGDGPGDAPDDLAAWGATVAAQQADDWMTLLDRLRRRTRHYRVVDEARAVDPGERKTVRRFVRRCAAELRIATPILQWIRPVRDQGDLVSLGDIAGCAIRQNGEHPVVYVRCDINDVRDRLRVVAHEVAHHSGADEPTARAYEHLALKRHTRR